MMIYGEVVEQLLQMEYIVHKVLCKKLRCNDHVNNDIIFLLRMNGKLQYLVMRLQMMELSL